MRSTTIVPQSSLFDQVEWKFNTKTRYAQAMNIPFHKCESCSNSIPYLMTRCDYCEREVDCLLGETEGLKKENSRLKELIGEMDDNSDDINWRNDFLSQAYEQDNYDHVNGYMEERA
jgi:hypothetical protein